MTLIETNFEGIRTMWNYLKGAFNNNLSRAEKLSFLDNCAASWADYFRNKKDGPEDLSMQLAAIDRIRQRIITT